MSTVPDLSAKKRAELIARNERLVRALRDNLRRRKDQARARNEHATAAPEAVPTAASGLSRTPFSSKSSRHGGTTAD